MHVTEARDSDTVDNQLAKLSDGELSTKEEENSNDQVPSEETEVAMETNLSVSNISNKKQLLTYSDLTANEGILKPSPLSLSAEVSNIETTSGENVSESDEIGDENPNLTEQITELEKEESKTLFQIGDHGKYITLRMI